MDSKNNLLSLNCFLTFIQTLKAILKKINYLTQLFVTLLKNVFHF